VSDAAVTMSRAIKRALVAQARRERPRECCGLLVGRRRAVAFAVATRNVDTDPDRFRVDDAAHIELRRVLRAFTPGLEVVGVYHSHPHSRARLSAHDVREAYYPNWIHVVVGLSGRGAEVRAFVVRRGSAQALPIRWRATTRV
jgi:proteasome lid subunit RPN8/RPN11